MGKEDRKRERYVEREKDGEKLSQIVSSLPV